MRRIFFALRSGAIAFVAVALIVIAFSYVECLLKGIPYIFDIALHGGLMGGMVVGCLIAILELVARSNSSSSR